MRKNTAILALFLAFLLPFTALASDWAWTAEPTPGALNSFPSGDDDDDDEESFENGNLSEAIILSEVMPNPEGSDNETEWIEIYNTGTENVDLGNWQLDDEEGGSDIYTFPANTIIEAQDFLVIYRVDSDIALNNDADSVRLFDYEGTLQDDVTYESSPENESYARIVLESDNQTAFAPLDWLIPTAHAATTESTVWHEAPWEWTESVTAGYLNPIYHFIEGEITDVVPFENKVHLTKDGNPMEISLNAINLTDELKTSLFAPGSEISGYATFKNNVYELQKFENSLTAAPLSSKNHTPALLLFLIACSCGAYYFLKIKRPTKIQTNRPSVGL